MSYNLAMSALDDGPRVRPIPSEDNEKVTPGDHRPDDRPDERAAKRPWLFIGRRFVEGIPGMKITRH